MIRMQASFDKAHQFAICVLGKHDGYLPTSEKLSQRRGRDMFYTALKGDNYREANCMSTREKKTSLQIPMGHIQMETGQ